MNTSNGGLPNEADKEAFRVAARRPPGSRSPDVDPIDFTLIGSALTRLFVPRLEQQRQVVERHRHIGMIRPQQRFFDP